MKQPENDLDVDFIGGAAPLTKKKRKPFVHSVRKQKGDRKSRLPGEKLKSLAGVLLQAGRQIELQFYSLLGSCIN